MRTLPFAHEPWMDDAACRSHPNPDLWFPPTSNPGDYAAALRICLQCPVRAECLDLAVRSGADAGIWGGMNPDQIRQMRRKAKR